MKNGAIEFLLRVAVISFVIVWLATEARGYVTALIAPLKMIFV